MISSPRRIVALMAFGSLLLATGCLTPLLVAPSTTPLGNRPYQETGKTVGESCTQSIFFIPFSTDASLKTALDDARLKVNADALVDVVVDVDSLYTLFYNRTCTVVHATGIRFSGQQAPFLRPGPAVPVVPVVPAKPPAEPPATPRVNKPVPTAAAAPAVSVKIPAKESRKQRLARLAREKKERTAERNRLIAEKKAATEAQRKAELEKKEKAVQEKAKALARRRAQEESKPVPGQFKIFCKFKAGDPVRVETKGSIIEGKFVRCVYFGVRIKKIDGQEGVVPFETIWIVRKPEPAAKTDEAVPKTSIPAKPKVPATSTAKTPAKPAKPQGSLAPARPGSH
ncbi:MAG TPA: hypothetical protein VM425_08995 [Myxococcota bacterium]|nr:hypothetical protein [Myxococcota bacterium]